MIIYINDLSKNISIQNKGTPPEVDLDENKKKVSIKYKGICVSDNKTEPTDDDKKKDDKNSGSGHFILRLYVYFNNYIISIENILILIFFVFKYESILIIIICYFIIGVNI